jgi:hypothetical protein
VPRPISTPTRRSVTTIATTVITNGRNCVQPCRHMLMAILGLASLKPVTTSTAASAASGTRLISSAKNTIDTTSSTPCQIADSRVRAPALTLTELRMMTDVIGRAPARPASMLPTPCANSSRSGGDTRLCGSSLSVASRFSSVSSEATMPSVSAASSTLASNKRDQSGESNMLDQPTPFLPITGTSTRCLPVTSQSDPAAPRISLITVPTSTVPDDEQRQRNEADQGRTRQQAAQRRADRAERVVAVRLRERHLAFEVLVVPDQVRELLEDQQHADRRQEPTDDAVREEVRQAASLHETEHDLQHAGQEDRGEERLEAAEPLDLRQHDRRETGRGTRDADVRTAQRTDDDAADDARQQARLQRRARGERDAEAQWDRDEEDDEARGEVAREALRQRQVLPVVRARSIRSGGAHGAQSRDGARQHAQAEPFINSVGFAAKRLRRTT